MAYAGDEGRRAELAAFTSGIQVQVVEQVKPVQMPTASMDMLAQYFLKSGSKLSTQVHWGRTEVVRMVESVGNPMSSPLCAATARSHIVNWSQLRGQHKHWLEAEYVCVVYRMRCCV